MKKDVKIEIYNSHSDDDISKIGRTITTNGTFETYPGGYLINYTEFLDEKNGSNTALRINKKDQTVVMNRTGSFSANMIFEKGKRTNCQYKTPVGEFVLGVFANEIKNNLHDDGGELSFNYTLDFNSGYTSDNELKISVRRV
ncbi:MAG: DUF1934 domain-containing protein [Clostridia bacterium]|nr:DUF1934 domain-containing protein [Clostridia bacterium]